MKWKSYDADKVEPEIQKVLSDLSGQLLIKYGLNKQSKSEIKKFVDAYISDFKNKGLHQELNTTVGISTFRPYEFTKDTSCDSSLNDLIKSISSFEYDWRLGSKTVQDQVNSKYESAGDKIVRGGRAKVILDSLVKIKGKNVAIEYETSINLDNGYFSLRQAIKDGRADYGVMIVPWHEEGPGRANESLATDRLDRDNDDNGNAIGPIFRIAIIRLLDLFKELKKT
ncbi:TPA: hypothetical protein ACGVAU_002814 [Vibrio vulnificus]|uniref:hypothetical protein n=1 Tax=Vibrio vulnificus TaxID=672 RepID=UPI0019D45E6D|nr:hypothetical protein [Vibrio vulnificus]MBN8146118.1 hypothetical protein [Vibrio vulnificus]HAS6161600.1 hypothetical protein [Vibrio vulnificus]HAS6299005.1 hypothetical protein [Vibrio vulnificus]HDY7433084.1 hypothetical protein [Vibrio vulnificus]HDY7478953.1 hypothetical protein [Vibrio vulnificus]